MSTKTITLNAIPFEISDGTSFTIKNLSENENVFVGSSEVSETYYSHMVLPQESVYVELSDKDVAYATSPVEKIKISITKD